MKCGSFLKQKKKKNQNTCDIGCQEPSCSQRGLGWGKIAPTVMGAVSNVDKPGRGETSCTAAQARGGARIKIWFSWTWVRLHNACLQPCHPDLMQLLCHRALEEKAGAVRPDSVTGSAPVVWSRDGQFLLLSRFYLEPGVQPRSMQLYFVAPQLPQQTQLDLGCITVQAAMRRHAWGWVAGSACCVARSWGMWWNTSGVRQQALASPSAKVSLVLSISAAVLCVQCLFCAAVVLCGLRTHGYIAEGDPQRTFICWYQWLHVVGDRDFFGTVTLRNLLLSSRLFLLRRMAQPFDSTSLPASPLTFAFLPTLLAGCC